MSLSVYYYFHQYHDFSRVASRNTITQFILQCSFSNVLFDQFIFALIHSFVSFISCNIYFIRSWKEVIDWCCQSELKFWTKKFNTFLFLNQNICSGYSNEPSWWDGSFEYDNIGFWWVLREINPNYAVLSPVVSRWCCQLEQWDNYYVNELQMKACHKTCLSVCVRFINSAMNLNGFQRDFILHEGQY